MNNDQITEHLAAKFDEWVESIPDLALRNLIIRDAYIAGGAIASLVNNEYARDYDIFFRTLETCARVTHYYATNVLAKGTVSKHAITLPNQVQLITHWWGGHDDILGQFDFEHTKAHWNASDNKLYIPDETKLAIRDKTLRYTGRSRYPVRSLVRAVDFQQRRWNLSYVTLLHIIADILKLKIESPAEFIKQLGGLYLDPQEENELEDIIATMF